MRTGNNPFEQSRTVPVPSPAVSLRFLITAAVVYIIYVNCECYQRVFHVMPLFFLADSNRDKPPSCGNSKRNRRRERERIESAKSCRMINIDINLWKLTPSAIGQHTPHVNPTVKWPLSSLRLQAKSREKKTTDK